MAKYATNKQKEELIELQRRTERKLKAQSRYMEDVSLERFGFDSSLLDEPVRITQSQIKNKIEELKEFNSKQYRLVNIGNKENREYVPSNKLDEAKGILKEYNRFNAMRQKSLKASKQFYYGLDENGNVVQYRRETPFEQTEEGRTFRPVKLQFGETEAGAIPKGLAYETLKITDEYELDKFISRYKSRATDFGSVRIQQLEDNFFEGLKESVSWQFARSIRKTLDELEVDAIDFLFLYDTTAVFNFDFIYDTKVTLADKKAQIKSQVEKLRTQKPEGYEEYRSIVTEYEKSL